MNRLAEAPALAVGLLLDAGLWVVVSLVAAGLIHEFLSTERMRHWMNRAGGGAVFAGMGLGALLPICSCGVVPLTVGLHQAGARLAAVIAFTVATPVINPAAVVLSYALLGPELTLAYVAFGLTAPLLVGWFTERHAPTAPDPKDAKGWLQSASVSSAANRMSVGPPQAASCTPAASDTSCCASGVRRAAAPPTVAVPFLRRLQRAFGWGIAELGPMLGFYIGVGIVLAALLAALVPPGWISTYLGSASPFGSLILVALFGASIYVCAVAHIPLVAAMLAAGAAPGAAIVFLVTGAATNLPEMLALRRVLGTRTVVLYVVSVVVLSILAGVLVNLWLVHYQPELDPLASLALSDIAQRLTPVVPAWLSWVSAVIVATLALWGTWNRMAARITRLLPSPSRA